MTLIQVLHLTAGMFDTGKHDTSLCQMLSDHKITLPCKTVSCANCALRCSSFMKEMRHEAD